MLYYYMKHFIDCTTEKSPKPSGNSRKLLETAGSFWLNFPKIQLKCLLLTSRESVVLFPPAIYLFWF